MPVFADTDHSLPLGLLRGALPSLLSLTHLRLCHCQGAQALESHMIVHVLTTHFHSILHSLKAPFLPTQINGWRIGGLMYEWMGIDRWK